MSPELKRSIVWTVVVCLALLVYVLSCAFVGAVR